MPESITGRRVLVVEDDRRTAEVIALYLRHAGHRVAVEHDGRTAIARARREPFDLLILDRMLPGADGLEICRTLTAERGVPVIFVTARTLEEDRIAGFAVGADDYVTKPFSPRELVARANALLRRAPLDAEPIRRLGDLEIDGARHEVRLAGARLALTPSEYAIVTTLADRAARPLSRSQLLGHLPGDSPDVLERTVDVHVRNIRRKFDLARDGASAMLETVMGVGYRLVEPD
ncbi:MAG TPA: response regulator transcription factor [Gemmatimonadales bacterium]|nr:response regulator transcription factor [Gemmatimonadales bacterium]